MNANKLYSSVVAISFIALFMTACGDAVLSIDYSEPGVEINPNMYGIFFEEINHGGEGGLHA